MPCAPTRATAARLSCASMGGGGYGVCDPAYAKRVEHFSGGMPIHVPFRSCGHTPGKTGAGMGFSPSVGSADAPKRPSGWCAAPGDAGGVSRHVTPRPNSDGFLMISS